MQLGTLLVLNPTTAFAAGCTTESTKFVYEDVGNPGASNNNRYYGIRGTTRSYNHQPICSNTGVAQTFFVRLSPDYSSWVETGVTQYATDSTANSHAWAEWRYLPSQSALKTYDPQAGILTTNTDYSLRLENGAGTTWEIYIAHASSPEAVTNWNHLDTTGSMGVFSGPVESELSRYGTGNASDHPTHLEEQRLFAGAYYGWQHLGCDYAQRSIMDWTAVKVSQSEWFMNAGTPGSGQC
ncbi:hypothetical protein [Nakamurella endophytica]|uniref:hypothetical protein n=1 Tax=Nakamurella endophytica TaxID=1748367 RepID=UPI00166AED01|nr:hypothetical protein [Nakamurella endophytica]